MKNYNQFINSENVLNEEFIGGLIKKAWKKGWEKYRKHKGVKEIDKIYKETEEKIKKELEDLKTTYMQQKVSEKLRIIPNYTNFLNEQTEEKVLTPEAAREIIKLSNEKIDIIINNAQKSMDEVLKKQGGASKNPMLSHLIQLKKSDLRMVYIQLKVEFLKKVGDKKLLKEVEVAKKNLEKELEQGYKKLDELGRKGDKGKIEIGQIYRYKTSDGIKTIKITGESEEKGRVMATYLIEKDGDLSPQTFQISNIDTDIVQNIEVGDQYKYLDSKGKLTDVEIKDKNLKDDGTITVETVKKGNVINVLPGRLRDKIKKS